MTALTQRFLTIARQLHSLTVWLCLTLLAIVFSSQLLVVILRYLFNVGFIELQDLVTYSFAMLAVLAIPTAIPSDTHVRVDVLRARQSNTVQRRVDCLAILLFLIPLFSLTLYFAWPLVSYSWSVREGSRETGGLPGFFIVLSALPLSCGLILVQGFAVLLKHHER